MNLRRRTYLKGIGGAVALGSVAPQAAAQPDRTVIFGHKRAEAANGVATNDEANTRRGSFRDTDEKFFLWIDPTNQPVNLGSFTIDEIDSISFYTKTDHAITGSTPNNFYLSIYTEPDGTDDSASWYGYLLNGEPYLSQDLDAPANQWNVWSTDDGDNQLTFYDPDTADIFGFYGQPTLQDLQAGDINWQDDFGHGEDQDIDYGTETVKSIVFATGSGFASEFEGYLDTLEISVTSGPGNSGNGQTVTIDLEPGKNSG